MIPPSPQLAAWKVGTDRWLSLDRPRIMGILNVTPDSFSDGGAYASPSKAASAALRMHQQGAAVIDVGGESTRPGSYSVEESEQISRVVPVIQLIRREVSAAKLLISVDTTRTEVAACALDAGADIVNDVSAGTDDPAMLELVAERGAAVVLMHRLTRPRLDSYSHAHVEPPDYGGDVCGAVARHLSERAHAAAMAGIDRASIMLDPGLGFGKTVAQNLALIARLPTVQSELGFPMLSAASRKSFVGKASGVETPADRVAGTLAISVMHAMQGVRLFRVHDVEAHRQALETVAAVMIPPERNDPVHAVVVHEGPSG